MSRSRRVVTASIALVVGIATASMLTACINPVEALVGKATGGKVDLAGKSVPKSFPKSVPLYKGEVTSGVQMGSGKDNIWNVIMKVPNYKVMSTISTQLKDAGFTTDLSTKVGADGGSLIYDNAKYDVAVVLKKSDSGQYTVDYAVSNQMDDYKSDQ